MANGNNNDFSQQAGAELQSLGGAPTGGGGKKGGGLGAFLGGLARDLGLLTLGAAVPGFGQGFVQAQQQSAAADAQATQNLLGFVSSNPLAVQDPDVQKMVKKRLGPELLEAFIGQANQITQQQQLGALTAAIAEGTRGPREFTPVTNVRDESTRLVTPSGQQVIAGQQGLSAPLISTDADVQVSRRISPTGAVTTEIAPTPASQKKFTEEVLARQGFGQLVSAKIAAGGDPVASAIDAAREMQEAGLPLTPNAAKLANAPADIFLKGVEQRQNIAIAQQGKQNEMVPRGELALLIDPVTGRNPPVGTTYGQVAGFVPLTSDKVKKLDAIQATLDTLEEFEVLTQELFQGVPEGDTIAAGRNALAQQIAARTNPDSAAAQFNSWLGSAPKIVRGMGEVGNLTETEQARGLSLISSLGFFETETSAQSKIDRLRRILQKGRDRAEGKKQLRAHETRREVEGVGSVIIREK